MIGAAWWINSREDRITGLLTPLTFLATSALVGMGVEVRPDTTAFAFFLTGVAVLYTRPRKSPIRGLAAGLLITLSVWGTQKVVYYGLPVVAALVLDWWSGRSRSNSERLLGGIRAFATGSALTLGGIATYLTVTKSWSDWFQWSVRWSFVHQLHYPPFPWSQNLLPLLSLHTWLFVLGIAGVVHTCKQLLATKNGKTVHPDLILLGLLVTTLASAAWQVAPYLYSFVPFLAILAMFAARGITATYRYLARLRTVQPAAGLFFLALGALLFAGELLHIRTILTRELTLDNSKQLEQLQLVGDLTQPGDAVFDIAGKRVARPGIHYFYFTDATIRQLEAATLAKEFPAGMVDRECAVYLHDERFSSFPHELKYFLVNNFQPMTEEIWLWGKRYLANQSPDGEGVFLAVKEGRYFIHPPQALTEGKIFIDGELISDSDLTLKKGIHQIQSDEKAPTFSILWLPRNGQHWQPRQHPAAVLSAL
jgi:hypothetical protein